MSPLPIAALTLVTKVDRKVRLVVSREECRDLRIWFSCFACDLELEEQAGVWRCPDCHIPLHGAEASFLLQESARLIKDELQRLFHKDSPWFWQRLWKSIWRSRTTSAR